MIKEKCYFVKTLIKMDIAKTFGTLYLTPAFHDWLHNQIKANGYEKDLNLKPVWRRRHEVINLDLEFEGLSKIMGLTYQEIDHVNYEATALGLDIYAGLFKEYHNID